MSIGPLRRLAGLLGLVALAPTAAMLVTERVSAADAALRAIATLLLTVVLGRLACWWVGHLLRGIDAPTPVDDPGRDGPRRRVGDVPAG